MLEHISANHILFLDIETVPMTSEYGQLPDNFKQLWGKKAKNLSKEEAPNPEELFERAGIYAEFGKIVCISVGYLYTTEDAEQKLRIKSFASDDEKDLLNNFTNLLNKRFNKPNYYLCAHNGKEFDYPYIARRCLINKIKLPILLDIAGKKPWEIHHLDTLELWKFGDYKSYTSLELLCGVFNIPTPKDDIDGSEVGKVYWQDKDLNRIATYCQKDVVSTVQVFLSYLGEALLSEDQIEYL